MAYNYHLPVFAQNLAAYLRDNFVGMLSTDIKTTKDTIAVKVFLHDPSFSDELELGEYVSYFIDNKK